jgi:hypothetical protein
MSGLYLSGASRFEDGIGGGFDFVAAAQEDALREKQERQSE